MMRFDESGWIRVTKYDKAERRALWMRVTEDAVEFCAGREGDDSYVKISRSEESVDQQTLYKLQDVGRTAEWGIYEQDISCECSDEHGEDCPFVMEDKIWEARAKITNAMKDLAKKGSDDS